MADRSPKAAGVLALLVLGAVALAVAARLTWWTQTHADALAGSITIRANGSQVDPLLIPVALLALAGLGAALATTGIVRRLVGVVLLLGGVWAAALAATSLWHAPASLYTDLIRPAASSAPPQLQAFGPLLATFGGLLVALAGGLVLTGFGARRALGARYDAPTGRRNPPALTRKSLAEDADPEAAVGWWKALDAGHDPTARADPTGDADLDPGATPVREAPTEGTDRSSTVDPGVSDDVARGV